MQITYNKTMFSDLPIKKIPIKGWNNLNELAIDFLIQDIPGYIGHLPVLI